jgi:HTH-type transcriptional regulator/antitoxin MqsA
MKCPSCGAAALVRDTRDMPYTHKGKTTIVAAVSADYCLACDEGVLDATKACSMRRNRGGSAG